MNDTNFYAMAVNSLITAMLTGGGVFRLINWRIKNLEQKQVQNDQTREAVIRIETKLDSALKNNK
jgi:hypothetical protein